MYDIDKLEVLVKFCSSTTNEKDIREVIENFVKDSIEALRGVEEEKVIDEFLKDLLG